MSATVTRSAPPRRCPSPRPARRKPGWLRHARTAGTAGHVPRERVVVPFLLLLFLAFTVRGVAATRLIPHVDEAATMLATEMVATRGVPIFPSGVLYLQGASLSYLLAPLSALTGGTIEQLTALRFVNVLMGTAVVLMTALLATRIARSWVPGIIAGLIVALDPASVAWSVYLRPYAALSLITIGLAYATVVLVMDGPARRGFGRDPLVWIAGLFLVGTFTHVGIWLLYPAVVLIAALTWGTGLLGPQRRVAVGLAAVMLAPVLFLVINSAVGPGSSTSSGDDGLSFVGSHLLTFERLLSPTVRLDIWTSLYHGSGLGVVMPILLAASSGVLLGRFMPAGREGDAARQRAFSAVLLLYWVPVVIAIAFVGSGAQHRYLVHVVPLGAIIIALAVYVLGRTIDLSRPRQAMVLPIAGVVALLFPAFFYGVIATSWRVNHRGEDADYFAAMAYVAGSHAPGQPIIVSLPPIAHVNLDEQARGDLHFLAGPSDGRRVGRYTWPVANGLLVDFWLGRDAIGSTEGLCNILANTQETSWVVVDSYRVRRAYPGNMATVIRGATTLVADGAGDVQVRRSRPLAQWWPSAVSACVADGMTPKEPTDSEL